MPKGLPFFMFLMPDLSKNVTPPKKKVTDELIFKTETDLETREFTSGKRLQGGGS